jgi:hypothetical protein
VGQILQSQKGKGVETGEVVGNPVKGQGWMDTAWGSQDITSGLFDPSALRPPKSPI